MFQKRLTIIVTLIGLAALVLAVIFRLELTDQNELTATYEAQPSNTAFVIDGQKVFLYGLYHVSWVGSREDKITALQNSAAAGFNLMHPALDTEDQEFLDLASELGIQIIAEINDENGTQAMVEKFKNHPAILGWLIADDFNSSSSTYTPDLIQETHQLIKSIAPNQLTYISGSTAHLENYLDVSDVIGIQTYSIPSDSLGTTDRLLNEAMFIRGSRRVAIIANIQVWAAPNKRPPTPLEIRNMTYQALLNGVDGILYYTYLDQTWNIEEHPDIWQGLTELAGELQELSPAILNGQLTRIGSSDPNVIIGQWEDDAQTYLVVINTTDQVVEDVTIPIEAELVQPMFTTPSPEPILENNQLIMSIPPQEVQVYRLR